MLVVLSPSKTLDFNDYALNQKFTQPEYLKDSEELVKILRGYSQAKIKTLMSVSDKIASLNVERFQNFKRPFTKQNAKPAILAFTGDVYQDIDVENYRAADFNFAQKHVRILSGLYGILRPLDLMQAYRLEMKTSLKNARGKDLYQFWGDRITKSVNTALRGVGSKSFLVNLASQEYYSVLQPEEIKAPIVTPVFKEKKGDNFKVVAIHAKRARGMMTNFIVRNKIDSVNDLKKFKEAKYSFNAKLSSDLELVFTR